MEKKWYSVEQIVVVLKQAGLGLQVAGMIRRGGQQDHVASAGRAPG